MNEKKVALRQSNHASYLSKIRADDKAKPNIILIFVDDMGYGDISCFGSRAINTPNLDKMADDGVKMNNFYASSPVCSPSRFSCLTGRYPTRGFVNAVFFPTITTSGKLLNKVLFPHGITGILPDEITIPEALGKSGYGTGMFGKWHLGDKSPHLPNDKGFDYFFGAHYSNDMTPYAYYRNKEIAIDAEVDQKLLTKTITNEINNYIEKNKDNPFFIYYASPFPHDPVSSSADFTGKSKGGAYGDCVEELDWSIGKIREKLEALDLTDETLIIFTSDNGPWFEGSPGGHRGRKGNSFDGGQMVPFIASWPEKIPKGKTINETAMNIDFFPTFLKMAGVPLPDDREIDGLDMMPLLTGELSENLHDELYFIKMNKLFGVRSKDDFKYCIKAKSENTTYSMKKQGPFLFNMTYDKDESYNTISHFPEVADKLSKKLEEKQRLFKENPRGWTSK